MSKPMTNYIGTKKIKAMPMTKIAYNQLRGWKTPENEDKTEMGYLVEYLNSVPNHADFEGYISWSPKAAFEASYSKYEALDFGKALELLKEGKGIARAGWNGKGMFLFLNEGSLPACELKYGELFEGVKTSLFNIGSENTYPRIPNINMKTASGSIVTGWLASQTDLLAEDWQVIL